MPHTELAELILDDSGYTAMWQKDKSPQAQTRLENLKELVRFMHDFDTLAGFLELVSLVMDAAEADDGERVTLMTLHAAKGLEFDNVFLPGWEEGLFPHQRAMDESGLAGLEEERRLAYVGITRARKRAQISFAQNRRMRGLYQAATPSRFVDELPEPHVEIVEVKSPFGGRQGNFSGYGNPYGSSRFDKTTDSFEASYDTPGWKRAKTRWQSDKGQSKRRSEPKLLEGELVASSTAKKSAFAVGARVFHNKFGYGNVTAADGNKLTVMFDDTRERKVVDDFLQAG